MTIQSRRKIGLTILEAVLRETRSVHRRNLLGGGLQTGSLEASSGHRLSDAERTLAYSVFDDLVRSGMLLQPRTDIAAPDEWVVVSEAGKDALKRRVLDDLDEALYDIDPRFVEMREGMWSSLSHDQPERNRNASNTAREIIDQILHELVPELRGREHKRRDRVKAVMTSRGKVSSRDIKTSQTLVDHIIAIHTDLLGEVHLHGSGSTRDIRELIAMTESALRQMLI